MYAVGELGQSPEKVIVNVPGAWITAQANIFFNNGDDYRRAVNLMHHFERVAGTPVYEYSGIPANFQRKFYVVLDDDMAAVEWKLRMGL